MKDYCERNFVSKGMCVQYAIHDFENKQGQRNLHCHIMLTLRGIDEQGKWMPKQKINPKAWTKELDGLKESYQKTERPLSDAIVDLAKMEVLNHNKRDLERMLQNERSERNRTHIRNRDQIL